MSMEAWTFIAHGIGCLVLCKFIYNVAYWFYACFLRGGKNLKKEFGEWAIVTGATDGIGKGMALELSKRGLKVLLISRSKDKLEETAKECTGETAVLVIDYSNFNEAAQEQVRQAIQNKDIGVLVNNVGCSYEHPEYFHDLPQEKVTMLMKLNVEATTYMTRIVLPGMVERKRGAVVSVASISGVLTAGLLAEYAASKAYVTHFMNSLTAEYGHLCPKMRFQVQYPHLVVSKLSKVRKASLTIPDVKPYAKAAVNAIGYDREISPYYAHWVIAEVMRKLPYGVSDFATMKLHVPLRKRALKKKAEKGE